METIDIKDLMVGSLVYWTTPFNKPDNKILARVKAVDVFSWGLDSTHLATLLLDDKTITSARMVELQPIPVSEEWFKRLGMRQIGWPNEGERFPRRWGYDVQGHAPKVEELEENGKRSWFLVLSDYTVKITSVHHLQSLFWHLCRVELTTK
jgi:hypothetical protein